MSKQLINQYYNQLDRAVQYSKTRNEDTIKSYFWILINDYAHKHNYEVVREVFIPGTKGKKVKPDGILRNLFGLDVGYWESKDEKDRIDDEIDAKRVKGYPFTNILFEDSDKAVLFQRGEEVQRVSVRESDQLHSIITKFVSFKSENVYKFEVALENFKADIPIIVETLRAKIEESGIKNKAYITKRNQFFELCKIEINPDITLADIREMMIQHILTSDIFNKIFDDPEFHRHNNIASELEKVIEALFTYSERKNLLGSIEHYYDAINAAAAGIADHHDKQKFLKVLYENFYKVYNPKAADRLGVVYTPNEIVNFMINGTEYLLGEYFGKSLSDKNVEILDPASGTGTFITSIIDVIPKSDLAYKYQNEIHANEVAILPYYIANLNIEFTFKQKMGYYAEFQNLCFVDTLDNIHAMEHTMGTEIEKYKTTGNLFGVSSENAERIKRQNSKKISVIIGNPPYNANQKNENENNKNREYDFIDKRIKDTYIKNSTAQKTKLYDMYSRFYRWSMDRVDKNGIVTMITNRSFIDSRTFDGFRKSVEDDFQYCFIVDTKSSVIDNPKIAGTTHNVFGIKTGVAIMFLVRKEIHDSHCKIFYVSLEDEWRKEIKLEWFRNNKLSSIQFENIRPDKNHNWIDLVENDFDSMIPVANKETKLTKLNEKDNSIFKLFSLGVVTARDEWVYDDNQKVLEQKIEFLIESYNKDVKKHFGKVANDDLKNVVDYSIKWTRSVKNDLSNGLKYKFSDGKIVNSSYRPFFKRKLYYSQKLIEMPSLQKDMFKNDLTGENKVITFTGPNSQKDFMTLIVNFVCDLHFVGAAAGTQCLPLYRYDETGNKIENITDWGLEQFQSHYKSKTLQGPQGDRKITKEDIFHYTYAVLHNPAYRKKYELNLKREFPRLPFYDYFFKWAQWGKELMELHINYETVNPFPLKEVTFKADEPKLSKQQKMEFAKAENFAEPEAMYAHQPKVKVKLKADHENGTIELDEITSLVGIPKEAWNYKLGNRTAIEWVLDQYKEKKPSDPTIAEKFDTYRFADYKAHVIDLLKRVTTVSVETVRIVGEMEKVSPVEPSAKADGNK